MPATVIDDPLGISFTFPDGTTAVRYMKTPNPALTRTLLVGLADMIHPHGAVEKIRSAHIYLTAIRRLTRDLAEDGFTGSAGDLTRATLAAYWMRAAHPVNEGCVRLLLRRADDLHQVLMPDVRALVDGRKYAQRRHADIEHLPPYSETEWQRLITTCRSIVDTSYSAHRRALEVAEGGGDPQVHGWTVQNTQWLLLHRGPEESQRLIAETTYDGRRPRRWGFPLNFTEASADLFPHTGIVIAYRLLFGAYTGIVPDGIEDLGLDDLAWAGDTTVLLSYIKDRTSKESRTLTRQATRLLEQWLDHSAVSRRFTPAELQERLWLRLCPNAARHWSAEREEYETLRRWVRRHGLFGDDGRPLKIHLHRIRTTHDALSEHPQWKGSRRATIDPNRTPRVEGDSYLTVTTAEQQAHVEEIITSAQSDLLRKAQPPIVLNDDQVAVLVQNYPERVVALGLDDAALEELVGGERDVFTAACADQLSGLHGPRGKPCPARPWVCLLCPLALFTRRHLPNLMRLRSFFSRQWNQTPSGHFMSVFGPYAQRLDEILQPGAYFSEHALNDASRQVRDTDNELPLRPEEATA